MQVTFESKGEGYSIVGESRGDPHRDRADCRPGDGGKGEFDIKAEPTFGAADNGATMAGTDSPSVLVFRPT